jgi:hypothetical protein
MRIDMQAIFSLFSHRGAPRASGKVKAIMGVVSADIVYSRFARSGSNSSHFVWLISDLEFYQTENGWIFAYKRMGGTVIFALEPLPTDTSHDWKHSETEFKTAYEEMKTLLKPKRCLFAAVGEDFKGLLEKEGFHSAQIGAEPWIELKDYRPRGNSAKGVRTARNQAVRSGVTVQKITGTALTDNIMKEIGSVLASWIGGRWTIISGFLNATDPLRYRECRTYFLARTESGELCGYLIATPVPAKKSYFLEDVVISPEAPQGTATFLVLEALHALELDQIPRASLGVVSLQDLPQSSGKNCHGLDHAVKTLSWVARHIYNSSGIALFRKRFRPDHWLPVFACLSTAAKSPTLWDWVKSLSVLALLHKPRLRFSMKALTKDSRSFLRKHLILMLLTIPSAVLFVFVNHLRPLPDDVLARFGFTPSAPLSEWIYRSIISDFLYFNFTHFAVTTIGLILLLWRFEGRISRKFMIPFILCLITFDDILNYALLIKPLELLHPLHFERLVLENGVGGSVILMSLLGIWVQHNQKKRQWLVPVIPLLLVMGLVFGTGQFVHFVFNLDHLLFFSIGYLFSIGLAYIQKRHNQALAKAPTPQPKVIGS